MDLPDMDLKWWLCRT